MPEKFLYLLTIFIFAGLAVLFEWGLGFRKLKKYTRLIGLIVLLTASASLVADPIATSWRIWQYSSSKTFGIFIFGGMAVETILFAILVTVAVSTATLIWADLEEKKEPIIKKTWEEIKNKFSNP